ncbi:DUF7507 domain-containing protein [Frankia sp. AgKG'84/4]|uniref:DUF7507 domain-containing protein n=1 Tax=Frankia sp. AgKG'84/4 TaxID=573490 RepID=UPI00200BCD32|nr:hypothetical protein [Frankia sp. AgKG'84/4]MCL9794802.1 hypothetical protein [Frankia sp. AgKG'84/4]
MPALFSLFSAGTVRWRSAARRRVARHVLLALPFALGVLTVAGTTATAAPATAPTAAAGAARAAVAADAASIALTASVSPTTFTTNRTALTFIFVVSNTGTVPLTDVRVQSYTLWYGLFTTCPSSTLDAGASMSCTAPYTAAGRDFLVNRVVGAGTATGQVPLGLVVSSELESATATYSPFNDDIGLSKNAAQERFTAAGQRLDYSYGIVNNTDATLTDVTVHDSSAGLSPILCPTGSLAPGARIICTAHYVTTEVDVALGAVTNDAYATGIAPGGENLRSANRSAFVTKVGTSGLSVAKSVAPATFRGAEETLTYQYLLTNTGTVNALTNIAVLDPHPGLGPVSCPGAELAPAGSMTCTATYVTTCADVAAGVVTDAAAATATIELGPQIVSAPTTATTTYRPVLDLTRPFPPICLPVLNLPPITVGPIQLPPITFQPWTIVSPAGLPG